MHKADATSSVVGDDGAGAGAGAQREGARESKQRGEAGGRGGRWAAKKGLAVRAPPSLFWPVWGRALWASSTRALPIAAL